MTPADAAPSRPGLDPDAAASRNRPRDRSWVTVPLIVATLGYVVGVIREHNDIVDDAFISFRFAQHLADGHGLVWNIPGPPTEGYTNFLWVVLLAALKRSGGDPEVLTPFFMGAVTLLTCALLLWIVKRHLGGISALAASIVAIYLADPFTATHTVSGLETPLAGLAVTTMVALVLEFQSGPSALAALTTATAFMLSLLVRPDTVLVVAGLAIALALSWRRIGLPRLALCFGVTAALGAAYAAWKLSYFGYLLPNPFYVKSAPSRVLALAGLRPVLGFFLHVVLQTVGLWLPLAIVLGIRRREIAAVLTHAARELRDVRRRTIALALIVPALLAWTYYTTIIHEVGFGSRFLFPTYPIVILAGAAAITFLADEHIVTWRAQRTLAALVVLLIFIRTDWTIAAHPAIFPAELHEPIAAALAGTGLGSNASVHFMGAGVIPYRSGFNLVDPVGLTDNDLCGRTSMTRDQYEQLLWSRAADVYLSAEPPASPNDEQPDEDPVMATPYVTYLLSDASKVFSLTWEHPRFGPIATPARRLFLYRRMRRLRDDWVWVGEDPSLPLWRRLHFKLLVYVRRDSPFRDRLIAALRPIATIPPSAVNLNAHP